MTTFRIAVIGGTGPQGKGLAYRFAKHGHEVVVGSRSAEKAEPVAAAIVPTATVIGAFHHVAAASLWSDAEYLDHEDVLVCGDSVEGKEIAQEMARSVTSRIGIDAGKLRLARQLEPLTAVLISINKRYKVRSGVRISGL